jgi:RsiW-degrading membrane proteinase PrsW (M82 family)
MKYHHPKFREQLFFFFSGALVSTPLPSFYRRIVYYLVATGSDYSWADMMVSVTVAPLFEEFAKIYPLFFRHGETEKSLFRLGFLTGLGFGVIEFLLYVLGHDATVVDRLPGLFFHATNTSIVAYGIAKKKILLFYLIAVGLHSLNNLSASYGFYWYIFGIPATIVSYLLSFYLSQKTTNKTVEY